MQEIFSYSAVKREREIENMYVSQSVYSCVGRKETEGG
jgi:hypothetical protein